LNTVSMFERAYQMTGGNAVDRCLLMERLRALTRRDGEGYVWREIGGGG